MKRLLEYEGDVSDFAMSFQVTRDSFGSVVPIDLKPNGSEIPVTNANRKGAGDSFLFCIS